MDEIMEWVRRAIQSGERDKYVLVINVAKLVTAQTDPKLRQIIKGADIVGVDGMPLVWYSKLLPESLPEKVSGIDIMLQMFRSACENGWSFYLLGGTQQVVAGVAKRVASEFPGLTVKGYRNGYFSDSEEIEVVETIRKSRADILLIGFGSPRKEMFVERWKGQFGVKVIHGVGGSFDIYAGYKKRAPMWMRSSGLEWSYRLLQEPRRMFLRYAVTNSKFAFLVCRDLPRLVWFKLFRLPVDRS